MALREALQRVLIDYQLSKDQPLKNNELAQFIRGEAKESLSAALGGEMAGLVAEGSPGLGVWAAVPWVGVFDPAITTSATD